MGLNWKYGKEQITEMIDSGMPLYATGNNFECLKMYRYRGKYFLDSLKRVGNDIFRHTDKVDLGPYDSIEEIIRNHVGVRLPFFTWEDRQSVGFRLVD